VKSSTFKKRNLHLLVITLGGFFSSIAFNNCSRNYSIVGVSGTESNFQRMIPSSNPLESATVDLGPTNNLDSTAPSSTSTATNPTSPTGISDAPSDAPAVDPGLGLDIPPTNSNPTSTNAEGDRIDLDQVVCDSGKVIKLSESESCRTPEDKKKDESEAKSEMAEVKSKCDKDEKGDKNDKDKELEEVAKNHNCSPLSASDIAELAAAAGPDLEDKSYMDVHGKLTIKSANNLQLDKIHGKVELGFANNAALINNIHGDMRMTAAQVGNVKSIDGHTFISTGAVGSIDQGKGDLCLGATSVKSISNMKGDVILVGPRNQRLVIESISNIKGHLTLINVEVKKLLKVDGKISLHNSTIINQSDVKKIVNN